jgi:hypothetical protein
VTWALTEARWQVVMRTFACLPLTYPIEYVWRLGVRAASA